MKRTYYFIEIALDKFMGQMRKPSDKELRDLRWGFANAESFADWDWKMRTNNNALRGREYVVARYISGNWARPMATVDFAHVVRMLAGSCEKYPVKAIYINDTTAKV